MNIQKSTYLSTYIIMCKVCIHIRLTIQTITCHDFFTALQIIRDLDIEYK